MSSIGTEYNYPVKDSDEDPSASPTTTQNENKMKKKKKYFALLSRRRFHKHWQHGEQRDGKRNCAGVAGRAIVHIHPMPRVAGVWAVQELDCIAFCTHSGTVSLMQTHTHSHSNKHRHTLTLWRSQGNILKTGAKCIFILGVSSALQTITFGCSHILTNSAQQTVRFVETNLCK